MSGWMSGFRFQSDTFTAKQNVKGNLVVYHPIEGEFAFLPKEDIKYFVEWLTETFLEDKENDKRRS